MKIAIYSRGLDTEQESPLSYLLYELKKHQIDIVVYQQLLQLYNLPNELKENIRTFQYTEELENTTDCLISLGGDGTMLDAVALVKDKGIPILGVNFGRLGFLANIHKEELSMAVDAIVNRTFVTDNRTLIHLDSNINLFSDSPFALNEFSIHKRDISPMIRINTYLNGEFLNTFWADGLIVSTPTGSTGYNMSCNGPIIFPDCSSFVITPVAPHNLNVRSIVVPDDNVISFEIEGRTEQFICALDARKEIVSKTVQLAVKKESFSVKLIRLNEGSFLSTLRNKLTWGMDKRN
ncbi:MAG: NAD kinase [Chitinophagaceae bacterium]|nr:NAD kinase [Chitinophagaceae bacterium]MCW5904160.1 NAD kinase [Chitinophagaceae bacterium]